MYNNPAMKTLYMTHGSASLTKTFHSIALHTKIPYSIMVKKYISAIKDGFQGKGPFASQIKKSFTNTTFLCNPVGKPIYYEGVYDYDRHKQAYHRAKMWMPYVANGKLMWRQHPRMKPLQRLFDAKPNLDIRHKQKPCVHRNLWKGDMPPIQVGMIGEYKGEKAIVVDKTIKKSKQRKYVGIGDPGNIFLSLDEANVNTLGFHMQEVLKPTWIVETKQGQHEICKSSSHFKRTNIIIQNFNPSIHINKYLK